MVKVIYAFWAVNAILLVVWYLRAKGHMKRDGYVSSGTFDAFWSCLLLAAIFLPPIGTCFLIFCIITKEYE